MSKRLLLIIILLAAIAGLVAYNVWQPQPVAVKDAAPEKAVASTAHDDGSELQSLAELNDHEPASRHLDIQSWTTAEGARVLFVAADELPMFDLRLTFAAGSSHDGDVPGLATLTNAMLNEGAAGQDANAIASGFDSLGAQFQNGAYRDMATLGLRSLTDSKLREPALKLFTQVIGQPDFPQEPLVRLKNQLLASFEFDKQNPGKQASDALFERLYGHHPYAHPSAGTAQSIPGITREQLIDFHQRAYAAGNAVIALVGQLSREEAEAIAARVSAALPKGPALARTEQPGPMKPGHQHIDFPSQQTHLMLGEIGIDRHDPDYAALYLGNQVFGGGGFGTRLMSEVREKRGLTYGVYSAFTAMQARGPFIINLQTRAELSEGTLKLVQDLLRDYIANGPTEDELNNAKRELAGSFPLSTASNSAVVGQLGAIGFYGLPLSYLEDFMQQVQSLTVDQVKAAMARHIDPDALVIVSVGPTVEQKELPPPTDAPVVDMPGVPH